ncbi:MAG TPA: hypothetical protein VF316_03235 [Polyangiaceae bacterium]
MTRPMPDCQRFEIAVDQRLRGALEEDEASALDAHCATCEGCRGYEEAARSMQLGLHALASDAREAVDWDRVERGIRKRMRARLHQLVLAGVLGAAAVTLSTWGFAPRGAVAQFAAEMTAIVGAVVLVRVVFVAREVRQISRLARGDELLARHRAMLDKQLRTLRRFRWIALAVVAWSLFNAERSVEMRHAIVHVGLACIVAISWLHALLVTYPRVRRELAELDPKGPR